MRGIIANIVNILSIVSIFNILHIVLDSINNSSTRVFFGCSYKNRILLTRQKKNATIQLDEGFYMLMQICRICQENKKLREFAVHGRVQPGRVCLKCRKERAKKEETEKAVKRVRRELREKERKESREETEKLKQELNERALYQPITLKERESIFRQQDGRCAICGRQENSIRLAVDHDHRTGKVRGLLCSRCNLGLGLFKDQVQFLLNAVKYIADRVG